MTARRLSGARLTRLVRWHELPLLVGLVILWMALWREVSWLALISGIVVSIITMRLFYLPPVVLAGRLNLWWSARYLFYFLQHLILASCQVAWLAVRPGPKPTTAIVAVKLRSRSDFILTLVGLTMSLIPGSLVVEVDRFGSILYLHVLNTSGDTSVTKTKIQGAHIEEMLIRALGSRTEVEALG